ncbi:MAG: hypothetical protein HWD60_14600 [Defluviicoccus sp.]|nr:MAG: hypothetical protein HWD60_14600 [Defluviicoccus sp.]
MAACRRPAKPHFRQRCIGIDATADPIHLAEDEHRFAMVIFGGLDKQGCGKCVVEWHAAAVQVQDR